MKATVHMKRKVFSTLAGHSHKTTPRLKQLHSEMWQWFRQKFLQSYLLRDLSDFVVLFSRGEAATDLTCGRCYMRHVIY